MSGTKKDLISYRLIRAEETFEDSKLLGANSRWNSAINRLYYAAFYAVNALLLSSNLSPTTHNGAKTLFSEHFIKPNIIDIEFGKSYSQLFMWRQKGDYDDLFDFSEEIVSPYFDIVERLIQEVKSKIN